jgi:hypothetical protein
MTYGGPYTLKKRNYHEEAPVGDYVRISQYPTTDMSGVQRRRKLVGQGSTVMMMKSQETLQSATIAPLSPLKVRKTRPNATIQQKASQNALRTILHQSQSHREIRGVDSKHIYDPFRASIVPDYATSFLSLENKRPPLSNTRPREATPSPTSSIVTITQPSFSSSSSSYNQVAFRSTAEDMGLPSVTKKLTKGAQRMVTQLRKLSKGKKANRPPSPAVMERNYSEARSQHGAANAVEELSDILISPPDVSNESPISPPVARNQSPMFIIGPSSVSTSVAPSITNEAPIDFIPAPNPIQPLLFHEVPSMIAIMGVRIVPELVDIPSMDEDTLRVTITPRGEIHYPFSYYQQDEAIYIHPPLAAVVIMDVS